MDPEEDPLVLEGDRPGPADLRPCVLSDGGHHVFSTGASREVRLQSDRVKVNDEDLSRLLGQVTALLSPCCPRRQSADQAKANHYQRTSNAEGYTGGINTNNNNNNIHNHNNRWVYFFSISHI